jgi:hypothetical protein
MTPLRDDAELRGPDRLAPPRVAVVRLNRRVLYVVGAALVVVVVAGLVALRAQGSRQDREASLARASHLPPAAGERWFDKVLDREPSPQPASVGTPLDTPPTVPSAPAAEVLRPPAGSPRTPVAPPPARPLSEAEASWFQLAFGGLALA